MKSTVILSGARTPIGSFMGSLSSLSAPKLGAIAIKGALERAKVRPEQVDEVLMGCVLQGGIGQAPARQAAIFAGIPESVPCTTVNKVCGSGMKTVMMAAQAIAYGDAEIIVAGGMESMSQTPYALHKARTGYRMGHGELTDLMIYDGLWDPYKDIHMGNAGELCARECGIPRSRQDEYAAESYRRALAAQAECRLQEEIVPVQVPQRKGDPIIVDTDEEPGRGNIEKLPTLPAAFEKEGTVTAGNASSINDAAAALVVCSEEKANELGLKPMARYIAHAQHAQAPEWFTTAPAFAIQKLLEKTGKKISDIDLFEVNEAFSVVALAVADKVGIPHDKMNVNGGAVALGHPIGMTGTRLILTLMYELKRRGGGIGIATPCIGGGEATAVMIEVQKS
ncbi:MAG TPA: acetyl-CoA C-acetyltransferase [Fimbriimonadales bacterium]|nr:acetyl-CoA C-acetyltransferase [Fimbriimonadales bacterium]